MAFHSNENKAMLWTLLSEQGLFNGIEGSRVPEVRKIFENSITQLSENGGDLMTLNKEFVQKMLKVLPMFKGMAPPQSGKRKGAIQEVYNAEKIQNNRIDKFNSKLSNVKNEFDSMIKLKKPNEIDFSDTKQNNYNSNIDQDLAAAIASRQLDMEQMVSSKQSSKQEAEAWINSENKSATPSPNTNVTIEVKEKPVKHVSFDDNVKTSDNSLDDLFGNLKQQTASLQKKPEDEGIVSLLKEIIMNQKILIDILKSNSEAIKKN